MNFLPGFNHTSLGKEPAYWLAFSGQKLLVRQKGDSVAIPCTVDLSELSLDHVRQQYLGALEGNPLYAAELLPNATAPEGMKFVGLRQLYGIDEDLFRLAGHAIQIVDWDRTHLYCGQCGSPTQTKTDERAKVCLKCGLVSFPRISPAVIVAVTRGKQILLARGTRFPTVMYSVLAGFVEPGETLEECVRREIREEAGIEVKNIAYFGSQPWPFPNSLMIGFTAEYASGEILIDESEIMDAGWFSTHNLPPIPDKISIARRLIDWFCDNCPA